MRRCFAWILIPISVTACMDEPLDPSGPQGMTLQQSPAPTYMVDHPDRIADEYIVRFREEGPDATQLARGLVETHGGEIFQVMESLGAFWGRLPPEAIPVLTEHPSVAYIEASVAIPPAADTQDVSSGNWGLDRIDQRDLPLDDLYTYDGEGSGVRIWIIDTGVDLSASDLDGRIDTTYSTSYNNTDPFDPCYDHGTPVAIVAAGSTYGVAKDAYINVARVSDDCQDGTMSSGAIAFSLEYIADNSPRPAVANGSFSRECPWYGCGPTVDDAVEYAVAEGVPVVVSAGNDGNDACGYSPARVGAALTVGATDDDDTRVSTGWESNYGSCLDLFAPGLDLSVGYRTFSGTSAAAPLVSGVVANYIEHSPPGGTASAVVGAATSDALSQIGMGSPNRLLYSHVPDAGVTASIMGPDSVGTHEACGWNSSVTGVVGTPQYEWKRDGVVVSTTSTYSTQDVGDSDFGLHLVVTRPSDGTTGSDLHVVQVDGPGGPMCQP